MSAQRTSKRLTPRQAAWAHQKTITASDLRFHGILDLIEEAFIAGAEWHEKQNHVPASSTAADADNLKKAR